MTRQVQCGGIAIGGGAPVSIQSMTNVDTRDSAALLHQIRELAEAGCDIVRVAIPDHDALESFARVRKQTDVPLVADIHFDYRLAIGAIEAGADKIRINPGNIGSAENVRKVVETAKKYRVPIRVGVNSGSLEKHILEEYGGVTADALAKSALETVEYMESLDFHDLVLSIKSSDVRMTYDAYRIASRKTDVPMHIGITESGTPTNGKLKSAIGIGGLLLSGIGDTLRVSLTDDPVQEVLFGKRILETVGLREKNIEIVSCPTCGRTAVDLISLAEEAERRLQPIAVRRQEKGMSPLKVAVMGCVVNGPGESREADYGIAGGKGEGLLFSHGEIIGKIPEAKLIDSLIELIEKEESETHD